MEERAQISFEYLLIASFTILLAIFSAVLVEVIRELALKAKAELLSTRARTIENIFSG